MSVCDPTEEPQGIGAQTAVVPPAAHAYLGFKKSAPSAPPPAPFSRARALRAVDDAQRTAELRAQHEAEQQRRREAETADAEARQGVADRVCTLALERFRARCIAPAVDVNAFGSLAECVAYAEGFGATLHRGEQTELSRALCALAFDALRTPDEFDQETREFVRDIEPEYAPQARRWFVVRDLGEPAPHYIGPATREGYVRAWRDSLPALRGAELIAKVQPRAPLEVVLWSDERLSDTDVRAWCRNTAGGERFEPVAYPWWLPGAESDEDSAASVYLPAAASTGGPALRGRAAGATTTAQGGLRTGLDALDAQFRGGPRLPTGSRVCISGPPENSKTLVALELAESFAEQGAFVVWLALDEQADRITARRLQRRGLSAAAAQAPTSADLARLEGVDLFVVEPTEPFEDLWAQAASEAGEQPVVFIVDSIQKLRTRAGEGRGERERIDAGLDAIQACQRKQSGTVVFTSEITRREGDPKGSVGIDYAATLHLSVKLSGGTLAVRTLKNRDGRKDPIKLAVDLDGQRLVDPVARAAADAEGLAWEAVSRALSGGAALSRNDLAKQLKGVVARDGLRRWLAAWELAGRLEAVDGGVRLV